MLMSRFTRFGTGAFAKPLQTVAILSLTISLIFLSLIISGCSSTSPGIRKFYLLSLRYNSTTLSKAESAISDISNLFSHKNSSNNNDTFQELRISYRGLCLETENSTFVCGRNGKALGDIHDDPLDLVKVGDTYQEKVSFTVPLWAALAFLIITWLMVLPNTIPAIPIPAITRKIAGVAAPLGALILMGAMVLQQVTTKAISTLVGELGLGAVVAHVGHGNEVFGWAAFALAAVAAMCCAAVAAAEWAVEKAQHRAEVLMARGVEAGMSKATGGRMGMEDLESLKSGFDSVRAYKNGGGVGELKKPASAAMGLAGRFFNRK